MISEHTLRPGGMKQLLRPTLIITLFTLVGQVIGFVIQVVIAAIFGAGADMDAFLAANTLPQYVITVLLNALGVVFIPVFVNYMAVGQENEAWEVASGVLNLCLFLLASLMLGGVLFAKPLLQLTTPGLSANSLNLASQVAMITWPAILATGLLSLLTGIYQAYGRFSWPAVAPVIGALVNLGLVLVLAQRLGVIGLAIAATTSVVLQGAVLLLAGFGRGRYRLTFNWRHPGVQQTLRLLWPLVVSGFLVRWTPVIDRYLASSLPEGSISQLGYASKVLSLLALLISTGIATVVFPRMALNVADDDIGGLKHTTSLGMRVMWLAVAPTVIVGGILALPFVTAIFQRNQFSQADAIGVAVLLQVYLLALVGTCLGSITGRTLYALKETRIMAVMGIVEALAYAVYTALLARQFGVLGIAWGYALYFNLSLLWQILVIRYKTGNTGGWTATGSFVRTLAAAALGGVTAWTVTMLTANLWLQLLSGGILGLLVYILALLIFRSAEAWLILNVAVEQVYLIRRMALNGWSNWG